MINLGSRKIKDLRLGSSKISRVYLGDRLVWTNKQWYVLKKGRIEYYYRDYWTFEINKGQKFRVTSQNGNSFSADVYVNGEVKEYTGIREWTFEATKYASVVRLYGSTASVVVEVYR